MGKMILCKCQTCGKLQDIMLGIGKVNVMVTPHTQKCAHICPVCGMYVHKDEVLDEPISLACPKCKTAMLRFDDRADAKDFPRLACADCGGELLEMGWGFWD